LVEYTNAVVAAETSTTVRPLSALDPDFQPGLGIGNHSSQPGPFNYPFRGLIDELSVYNRALSPTEIQAIYGAGSAGKNPPPARL
jgi:Concanavalin A-like lectin/glucanases superfamily